LGIDMTNAKRLVPFLDLPVLFFPFMNSSFNFHSDLVAPPEFIGDRYVFNCVAASHFFTMKSKSSGATTGIKPESPRNGSNLNQNVSFLRVGGSAHRRDAPDVWWALTQPNGSYFIRFAGWLLVKILRGTCSEVTLDCVSFTLALSKLKSIGGSPRLVLAATHRSLFDFLILSFIFFSVPELQVDIPSIAAAEEFERLPFVGWLARCMGAFFLRRGRGHADSELTTSIKSVEKQCKGTYATFEVFLEGTRSRDRRFAEPKTGFIKCLRQTAGTSVIVPITISYERIPEQEVMATEVGSGIRSSMHVQGMFSWLKVSDLRSFFLSIDCMSHS
jgi:1-acyl-sn-glycerol-3-phosphate acyltransferase